MKRYFSTISLIATILAIFTLVAVNLSAQGPVFSHRRAHKLANNLGLGTRIAASLLLNGGFPNSWVKAAGGKKPPGYLQWPIPNRRLGRGFGSDNGRHKAIDITAPKGTPVHAMAPGIVGYADDGVKGYGNMVMLIHSGGWVTLYAHLSQFKVEPGRRIRRNAVIGKVGNTGISRGDHLHFALLIRGKPVDPMKYMRGMPRNKNAISKNLEDYLRSLTLSKKM
jgi:murein DD-endopeptidase MepM/ murein hydrolase activator NlpD